MKGECGAYWISKRSDDSTRGLMLRHAEDDTVQMRWSAEMKDFALKK